MPIDNSKEYKGKIEIGRVISNKMNKSITVLLEHKVKHPLYGKFIKKSTKIYAHDEKNETNEGDIVSVIQCRPLSKIKSWKLHKIIERVQ